MKKIILSTAIIFAVAAFFTGCSNGSGSGSGSDSNKITDEGILFDRSLTTVSIDADNYEFQDGNYIASYKSVLDGTAYLEILEFTFLNDAHNVEFTRKTEYSYNNSTKTIYRQVNASQEDLSTLSGPTTFSEEIIFLKTIIDYTDSTRTKFYGSKTVNGYLANGTPVQMPGTAYIKKRD